MEIEPPLQETFKTLFKNSYIKQNEKNNHIMVEETELPLIDLNRLNFGHLEQEKCIKDMAEASTEWGFFQVVNHGIPEDLLESLQCEEKKLFHQPFSKKTQENFLHLSANSYRWGNLKATYPWQFHWSEAFHISLTDISRMDDRKNLRSTIEMYATEVAALAQKLSQLLVKKVGVKSTYFVENCKPSSSYLRMNRYPPCPFSAQVFGLIPHTDTDFLTIVYQDEVGGLQFKKDGRWVSVKPSPKAILVNIGDLFQALSNGVYKSIEHRVVAPEEVERFSVAYFFCPSHDAVIKSCSHPPLYRTFSFREYRQQIQQDIEATGDKVGLSRFLL